MKKLLFVAALVMAALNLKAQAPADSVSVMFRHLSDTNTELVRMTNANVAHAAMVGTGGGVVLIGTLLSLQGSSLVESGRVEQGAKMSKTGAWISTVGVAFIAASFIPLATSRVKLDGRGLVVPLHK